MRSLLHDDQLKRLSALGDQLKAYWAIVDFEAFWPDLKKALASYIRAGHFDPWKAAGHSRRGNLARQRRLGHVLHHFMGNGHHILVEMMHDPK